MNQLDSFISPLVQDQFPEFYREEGPLFVLFAQEYYKWLETEEELVNDVNVSGGTIFHSRKLLEYHDVDQTVDRFIIYFKEKYLKGIDFDTFSNKKLLVKAAIDLFRSKGTEKSIDLLFKLVYGTKIEIYTPGDDILKPSDGKWVIPQYLELTVKEKTKSFVGKLVHGSKSGASAVVEYLITRNIKGHLIDIIYLSNLEGNFLKDDIINTGGSDDGCPQVIGSLSTVDVTLQGQGFTAGEEVYIVSTQGVEGKARVTKVEDQTGVVQFFLIEGGWGYSLTANTIVSTKVLSFDSDLIELEEFPDFTYTQDDIIYNFDKFNSTAATEILNQIGSLPPKDATLYSFLNTIIEDFPEENSDFKIGDTDNSNAIDLNDAINFLKYSAHSTGITASALYKYRNLIMPQAVANTYIRETYLYAHPARIPLFTRATQELYNIFPTDIIGEINVGDILSTLNGNTVVVTASNKVIDSNTATLIVGPIDGTIDIANNSTANISLYNPASAVIVTESDIDFKISDTITQSDGKATGIVTKIKPVTILTIDTIDGTGLAKGLAVGNYIRQPVGGTATAYGYISAVPRESNYGRTNVSIIAVSNTVGVFNNTASVVVWPDNSNSTTLDTASISLAETGYMYYTSSGAGLWNTGNGNTFSTSTSASANIKIASVVGGIYVANTSNNISATGNVIGSNTSSLGVVDINNTFYGTGVSKLSLYFSNNTFYTPNISYVSTGFGADYKIGYVSDTETVLANPDRPSSNNDGPATDSVRYIDMVITGANSTFGYMSDLYIANGGSGYSNTDTVTFTGGTTGTNAGDATIVTDNAGVIVGTGLGVEVGSGYYATPTVTITTSTGSNANLVPLFPLGFPKLPPGDLSYTILDLLTFELLTIGTISSLTGINPGENYNTDPFTLTYEPSIAAYGKRDYIINLDTSSINGAFILNELIEQYNEIDVTEIEGTNYSGNTTTFDLAEYVYSTDTINITASGTVRVASEGNGIHDIVVEGVSGIFKPTINVSILTVGSTGGFSVDNNITQGGVSGNVVAKSPTTLVVGNVTGGAFISGGSNVQVTGTPGTNTNITAASSNVAVTGTPTENAAIISIGGIELYDLTVASTTGFGVGNVVSQTGVSGTVVYANTNTLVIKNATGSFNVSGDNVVRVSNTLVNTSVSAVSSVINASVLTFAQNTTGFSVDDIVTQGAVSGNVVIRANNSITVRNITGGYFIVNTIYSLLASTSNSHLTITSANNIATDTITARGRVRSYDANNGILDVKRISLFADFSANATNKIVGVSSTANAVIVSTQYNTSTPIIGTNANVQANVITGVGSISALKVIDSGFGYVQDEGITIVSMDGTREASGKANILNQGKRKGRYTSRDGFLDDNNYIHDGEYYQEFSYEVQSSVPLDKYKDLLKQVLHVAGTKMYGKFKTSSLSNTVITSADSSVSITTT